MNQEQTICMPVKEEVLNSLGMRNITLPVQCQADVLRRQFASAPQFSSIDLEDVLRLREKKLRVILVGAHQYSLQQCAMYLATMADQSPGEDPLDHLQERLSKWQSLDYNKEDESPDLPKKMMVIPATLIDPPSSTEPGQAIPKIPLGELECTALYVETPDEAIVTANVTNPMLYSFEEERMPHLFVAVRPQQMDRALSKHLQLTHGFVVVQVGETTQDYLEDAFWQLSQEFYPKLRENANVCAKTVVRHLKHLMGASFHQGHIQSAIARTFHLGLGGETLTSTHFSFLPTPLSTTTTGRETLESMVELDNIKTAIRRLLAMDQLNSRRREAKLAVTPRHRHMAFAGPPGTGKTVCARLLAQILQEEGEGSGTFVEGGRADMIGAYLGQTSPKIAKLFQKAKGGVLFLDEIGALVSQCAGTGDIYAEEAINALVYHMDRNPETIVIFATYADEMKEFLDSNPGLGSRVAQTIPFPSYEGDTLLHILQNLVAGQGYAMEAAAVSTCGTYLQRRRDADPRTFGNGREVRRIFTAAEEEMAVRITQNGDAPLTITKADMERAITRLQPEEKPLGRLIGFAG